MRIFWASLVGPSRLTWLCYPARWQDHTRQARSAQTNYLAEVGRQQVC